MSKTMKRVSALLLAILMILTYMPMMQETAYAAKKKAKKPAAVKWAKGFPKVKGQTIQLKWKKAKNAKKYQVTIKDNTTKLTATKTSKKTKLNIKGQYGTKYTIQVKGINGKKKGKAAKKSLSIGKDPKITAAEKKAQDALNKAAKEEKAAAKLEKDLAAAVKAMETAQANSATQKEAVEKAKAIIDAYDNLTPEEQADVPDALKDAIEDAREAVKEAELAGATELKLDSWNPEVKKALNDLIAANKGKKNKYVVFDFDNTCSIYDVEEQLAVYQLQTMSFAKDMTAEKLADVLDTEIGLDKEAFPDGLNTKLDAAKMDVSYFTGQSSYQDWIDDITAAYQRLLDAGYKPRPEGYPLGTYDETNADWLEFATKMRAMYDLVYDSESAAIAYPWVLYWFTGMTEQEVYDLAKASHSYYKEQDTKYVHWVSPANPEQKAEGVNYWWSHGTQVSENIKELMAALDNNGIDVWVCSASATDPIRAAVDEFGLHDHVTGVMAMTNKLENDKYVSEYDWDGGNAWLTDGKGWKKDTELQKTQTQGRGKVIAIKNVVYPKYDDYGPIAGFMDSTGDYNFCTEFKDLEVVCCFNRASRKVTDGGGVIAELAVYQADKLGYDYATARANGDTLYVLQGRDETGKRSLRPYRETIRVTDSTADPAVGDAPKLFAKADNQTQYNKMVELGMDTETIVNDFAIKTAKDDPKYGFSFKYGFVYGQPGKGLGPRFDGIDFVGYHKEGKGTEKKLLKLNSWNPEVRNALNAMMLNADNAEGQYVIFDFDNTCSIYDVEEQLAVYQLQTMAFAKDMTAEKLADVLDTEIGLDKEAFQDGLNTKLDATTMDVSYFTGQSSYQDWIDDITAAYQRLLDAGYKPRPEGYPLGTYDETNADWLEFATKMRAMYDLVYDSESAAIAYPWVLYWFTGMTEQEVYDLAKASHSYYKEQDTKYVHWVSPANPEQKAEGVNYWWSFGTQVSENINELMEALDANGIDVWVCSASATDPIRAAVDVWGLHDYVTGVMAMTNKLESNKYIAKYDWDGGNAWLTDGKGWKKDTALQKTQTQGKGKVIAIQNVVYPKYNNHGPIAGFMDSTGDYNFCTEFETLQTVCCFNRASRKVTDGGGVIAELAVYQADELGYDYAKAQKAGDTLYVLQGRDETGKRSLRPYRETIRVTDSTADPAVGDAPKLFAKADNQTQYNKMVELGMDTKTIVNDFAIKTAKDDPKYGFSFKYGFVYGAPGEGLGPRFQDDTFNPDGVDFAGYHSQK